MPEITSLLTPALLVILFAWLRSDLRKLHDRLDAMARGSNQRLDAAAKGFNERLDASHRDIHERLDEGFDAVLRAIADLRERMAKMEGSLEGFLAGRRDHDAACAPPSRERRSRRLHSSGTSDGQTETGCRAASAGDLPWRMSWRSWRGRAAARPRIRRCPR